MNIEWTSNRPTSPGWYRIKGNIPSTWTGMALIVKDGGYLREIYSMPDDGFHVLVITDAGSSKWHYLHLLNELEWSTEEIK